jgi:hypothetical protein
MKRDYSKDEETWEMLRGPYEIEEFGHTYTVARQCSCVKEEIEADAETVEMSFL